MPAADAQRVWFPEMVERLRSRWQEGSSVEALKTSAPDPSAFVGVALLLMIVALAASSIPARRAARIDPMLALRAG
jgi:ABC-type lipoprotein release transport system permease subunit